MRGFLLKYCPHIVCVPLFFMAFAMCYLDVFRWMAERYASPDSYYSHGVIIPFISGGLIWRERERLKGADVEKFMPGLVIVVAALLTHVLATVLYIFSLSGFSILFFMAGFSLFLFGKGVTRIIAFPLLYLVFMFPLPLAVIGMVSLPLKLLVAKVSVAFAAFLGIPIFREGFHITIPAGNLLVGNPCSGLRSLITFLALGALLSYLGRFSLAGKLALFVSVVPVALATNMIRVTLLILISHYWGIEAASPETLVHGGSGVLTFILGFALLAGGGAWLERTCL